MGEEGSVGTATGTALKWGRRERVIIYCLGAMRQR